jgi:hypothetical protein
MDTGGLGHGSMEGSHEYGIEPSGSITGNEIIDQLRECYFLKKGSVI